MAFRTFRCVKRGCSKAVQTEGDVCQDCKRRQAHRLRCQADYEKRMRRGQMDA